MRMRGIKRKKNLAFLTLITGICILLPLLPGAHRSLQNHSVDKITHATPDIRETRENCRLLGLVSHIPPDEERLQDIIDAFSRPSYHQNSGWSLAAYSDINTGGYLPVPGKPMIIRTHVPVTFDHEIFMAASTLTTRLQPSIILGHLRNASSGCTHVADPHPFEAVYDGRHFLMTHNGGVWGKDLDYLIHNLISGRTLPGSCPDSPIDSEYLFIFLMELIDLHDGDVWNAIREWSRTLVNAFENEWNALNILLTDGDMLWGVRLSYRSTSFSLHYKEISEPYCHGISTQALDPDWIPLPNYSLIELKAGHPPYIEKIPYPLLDEQTLPNHVHNPHLVQTIEE